MSNIGFFLANPKRPVSSVNMVVYCFGKMYKMATGAKDVETKYWNLNKQRASVSLDYEEGKHLNALLSNFKIQAEKAIRDCELNYTVPTNEELRNSIALLLNPVPQPLPSKQIFIIPFIEQFIKDVTRAKLTINRYNTTLLILQNYEVFIGKKLTWYDMDMNFYNNFQKFMYNQDLSINYFGDMIKNIKMFVHAAEEANLHDVRLPKNFKTLSETADSIYLNVDELIKLHNLVIDEKLVLENHATKIVNVNGNLERKVLALQNCRDMFLIGAFTALRFGDYSRLMPMKHTNKFIARVSEKKGIKTVIPMHYVISEILQKRENVLPPHISNVKLNKQLKDLCKYAKINDPIEVTITRGGNKQRTLYKKWQLVTTHTARRSGATNMLMADIDMITIMSFTGHVTTKSFLKYVKASQEQLAVKAATNPYFIKKE